MNKSNLREEIFKLVYSLEVQKEDESSQIDLYLENSELSDKEKEKIKEEVCKIIDLKEDIENQISKNLKSGWSIERISKVNISILRIAIYEMIYGKLPYKVVINEAVELAKKYGVQLVVRSSLNESEGTIVKGVGKKMERMLISGVALDREADRISVIGIADVPGSAFKLFHTLAKNNINVDIIIQSVGRDGTKDISFTVSHNNLNEAVELLNSCKDQLGFDHIEYNCDVVKLSVVGSGMMSHPGVAAKMFECLYNENININMIATSEIRITVLIPEKDVLRAMNAVHDAFGLAE